MASPRRPVRLLDKSNISSAYPKELLADFSTGELTLIDTNGQPVAVDPLSLETSGDGNAINEITVSGRKITIKKDVTFLTEHPNISTKTDTTSEETVSEAGNFTVIDSISRDSNGHVTAINTKTITLPNASIIIEQNKGLEQKFWRGTQAEYDALTTKDEGTMYIITDASGEPTTIGDMLASVYDPQGKAQDIFAYVDAAISDAIGGSY